MRNKERPQHDYGTTAPQGGQAGTGHSGTGQGGEQAILELGREEANGELLLQLANTEKGKCKTAAQKALAQLEYDPAASLWAKLVKGKWMGSHILSDACSDCVSEQIAPIILKRLSELLDEGDTKRLEIEQLNFCFHLMLGKASPQMLEVYRFLAENASRIAQACLF